MKFPRYFLVSIALLFFANSAEACWPSWYTPKGYYMYRVYNNRPDPELQIDDCNPEALKNCKEWQKLTSDSISLEDIHNVVYKMTLKEFETLFDNRSATYKNTFAQWITKKDTTILDFLLLAKTNEHVRVKHNSRWYYPSMETGARMTLDEIARKALSTNDKRLRDRYLLQAVRALFSLSRHEECIGLWENEISHLSEDNLMRRLIHPYIAGAEFHTKHTKKAIEHFAQIGDIKSMLFCDGRTGEELTLIDELELVCEYAPNSKFIEQTLQTYIRKMEPTGDFFHEDRFEKLPEFHKLYTLCLKMARGGKSNNPAMWYYTAAFMADLSGDTTNASYLLALAEKSKSSAYIDESIKIFRIYLDARLLPYNTAYESRLLGQLKWLDAKIVANIDDNILKETARGYKLHNGESYYYWNDMMRKIVLGEVCPRMIKSGNSIRALQLANMADNRLLSLVDKIYSGYNNNSVYPLTAYRHSEHFNYHDYSNHFFEMIDSLEVNTAIKYVKRTDVPKNELDHFLNSRSYTNRDYLNDIIGTKYLRSMKYEKALEYLGAVSEAYKNHHNVYMIYDPFSIEPKEIKKKIDFKYDFAKEMHSLEQSINLTSEPNRKARLLIKYAIGIRNSFDYCWGLTQYYRGSAYGYWGQVCEKRDWTNDKYTTAAMKQVKESTKLACKIVTDDEIGADIQYMLGNYRTVSKKYPNTEKGELVRGKCDNLYDYHIESFRRTSYYEFDGL